MSFKRGDKVVCINRSGFWIKSILQEGAEYTVSSTYCDSKGYRTLYLVEVGGDRYFSSKRFALATPQPAYLELFQ